MGRISDLCQSTWVNEWAATGNEIPQEVRALTSGATQSSSWFELLYSSEYTTANEWARLPTGKLAARDLRNHYNKHGELPKAQMSVVRLVLRDVARSMSARYPRSKEEAAKPTPKQETIQIFADQIRSLQCAVDDNTPKELADWLRPGTDKSSVTKEHVSTRGQEVGRLSTHPTVPSSDLQEHSNTAGEIITGRRLSIFTPRSQELSTPIKHDTSSEALAYSKPHNSTDSTKITTSAHGSTREQDDAEWDLVTQEHEQDDVASHRCHG
ncbi:hypothetical protein LTR70_007110 [Exophiala xenobiotica]|uniref:Gag protein n=1 Tax=Lithohypha guttulata TaxID=1690604 RepID=A0ABR0K681_9EURO|nr:hypothetical protein LTR24_006307 [Lithohypha guttulata]KAK5314481.1 hypothetical protein LTR70_007110 [Exophiala xenobiotica]